MPGKVSWDAFTAEIVDISLTPADRIVPDARLVQDLDLDSLALIELVVVMVDKYELTIPDDLDAERWKDLTAGQLFDAVERGSLS
jgi:acyl carrier protein